jgi:uncharacterized membrane protein affecting hemolysin expression
MALIALSYALLTFVIILLCIALGWVLVRSIQWHYLNKPKHQPDTFEEHIDDYFSRNGANFVHRRYF